MLGLTSSCWIAFIAGLGGGIHCVGMCGGLVTASCSGHKDVMKYQIGRLLGYLLTAILAGTMGSGVTTLLSSDWVSLGGGLIIGGLLIYWGIMNARGKKAELPLPEFLRTTYRELWVRLVKNNMNESRSFFTGLISILLPCGLLYGIVLGTMALSNWRDALLSMFFFWLGTLPLMMAAPEIVRKILTPFKSKLPRAYAVGLICIGVATISLRVLNTYQTLTCH